MQRFQVLYEIGLHGEGIPVLFLILVWELIQRPTNVLGNAESHRPWNPQTYIGCLHQIPPIRV